MTSATSLPDSSAILSLSMIKRDYAATGNSVLADGSTWTILRHA
jgi:hypothetical protein